jgi:hypothetical protein
MAAPSPFWGPQTNDDDDGDDSKYDAFWQHVRQEARRFGMKPPRPFTPEYLAQLKNMLPADQYMEQYLEQKIPEAPAAPTPTAPQDTAPSVHFIPPPPPPPFPFVAPASTPSASTTSASTPAALTPHASTPHMAPAAPVSMWAHICTLHRKSYCLTCTPDEKRLNSSKFCQVCFQKRPKTRNTQGLYICLSCSVNTSGKESSD